MSLMCTSNKQWAPNLAVTQCFNKVNSDKFAFCNACLYDSYHNTITTNQKD